MKPPIQNGRRPLFAALSFLFLLLPVPVARSANYLFGPHEDYLGYGGLGVALAGMLGTLCAGACLAVISLIRREKPKLWPGFCLLSHTVIIIWVLCNLPG